MTAPETLFDLPTNPDEFGVVLPSPNLRRLDFSGLDYATSRRAIIEYISTYFPNDFNDFVTSNGLMMLTEIVASTVAKLSLRADLLATDSTFATAKSEEAIVNHLALINQRMKRQTPAIVDIEISVDRPLFSDLEIDAGTSFSVQGIDGAQVVYEIYRAPGDWTSKLVVPAGKRGIVAYGLEGQFAPTVSFISPGGANQKYTIQDNNILEYPVFVDVVFGSSIEEWKVITEPIERYGATDKVVEINFIQNTMVFRFGDDVTGSSPVSGSTINIRHRVGGGIRGRIGIGQIDTGRQLTPLPPANAAVSVRFRNITASIGGVDVETIEQAKKRAPRDFSMQRSIVTSDDYAQAAASFNHPVFGAISKSVATIRTSKNTNRVEIYALAEGSDGRPVAPNAGLKAGLVTHFSDLNVLTDSVVILDGAIRPVDIEMTVIMNRNYDGSVLKAKVESAITNFFDLSKWEMGHPLYISTLIEIVKSIDGITYIDLFKPSNNIIPIDTVANSSSDGVGFNELIVEGARDIKYHYERNPPPSGTRK